MASVVAESASVVAEPPYFWQRDSSSGGNAAGSSSSVVAERIGPVVAGKGIRLETKVVLRPVIITPNEGRRWMEEFVPAPRTKGVDKRIRLTLFDGILLLGRAVVDLQADKCTAVVSFGEGALVTMAYLSKEARMAAYKERHVKEYEIERLELGIQALTHIVLVSPHSFPIKF